MTREEAYEALERASNRDCPTCRALNRTLGSMQPEIGYDDMATFYICYRCDCGQVEYENYRFRKS